MNVNMSQLEPLIIFFAVALLFLVIMLWQSFRISALKQLVQMNIANHEAAAKGQQNILGQLIDKQQLQLQNVFAQQMADLRIKLLRELSGQKEQLNQNQNKALDQLITHLNSTTQKNRQELAQSLRQNSEQMAQRIDALTQNTDLRLKEISNGVEKRLTEGFEKTTKTFSDILQRLALIDDAQKKITELSNNVVSLQEVLNDKRSRGAFGEVQLSSLIRNVLPEQSFKLQHTLSNGKIADCVLFLPEPTGNVVIDAKFPLESYRTMMDVEQDEFTRKNSQRQFKIDIKKHINDISDKYLIDKETADGAIMFIPAEAIFAEIHGHQNDLVDYANKKRVWLASPTTLMAILTTARAVLKDEATRTQIHIIQAHLSHLAEDFDRFKGRFANLAKHIDQAASDVKQIHTSANKISTRFEKIEQVELETHASTELTKELDVELNQAVSSELLEH